MFLASAVYDLLPSPCYSAVYQKAGNKMSAMQDSRPFGIYQTICARPRVDQFVSTYFRYQKFRLQSKRGNPAKETLELKKKFQAIPQKSNTSSFSNLPLLNLYPQPVCDGTDPLRDSLWNSFQASQC